MLALFLHVYESTSQARFIAEFSNQGDLLILLFFLAGLMNLQRYLQSFALSSQIHNSPLGYWQAIAASGMCYLCQ